MMAESKAADSDSNLQMSTSRAMFSHVVFHKIQELYTVDTPLVVQFSINHENLTPSADDWIGLFRIGWLSVNDHILSAKVNSTEQDLNSPAMKTATFNVADIKLEDGEFYQFCYVVASRQVRGVSTPFQFITDDFEVVSDNMDSSNFVHKEMNSFVQPVPEVETDNTVNASEEIPIMAASDEKQETSQTVSEQQTTVGCLEVALSKANLEIQRYREENSELQTRLEDSRQENSRLISELDTLKRKLDEKQETTLILTAELSAVKSQLSAEQDTVAELNMSLNALKDAQHEITERNNKLRRQNGLLVDERSKLMTEKQELLERNKELVEAIEQLRQEKEMRELSAEPVEANSDIGGYNTVAPVDVSVGVGNIADERVRMQSSSTLQNGSYNYSAIGVGQLLANDTMVTSSYQGHGLPPFAANSHPPSADLPPPYIPQAPMYPYPVTSTWYPNPYTGYVPEAYRNVNAQPNYHY